MILTLAKQFLIRVGGGICRVDRAQEYIEGRSTENHHRGAKRSILIFMEQLLQVIPKERIIIALESFIDEIVIRGWKRED